MLLTTVRRQQSGKNMANFLKKASSKDVNLTAPLTQRKVVRRNTQNFASMMTLETQPSMKDDLSEILISDIQEETKSLLFEQIDKPFQRSQYNDVISRQFSTMSGQIMDSEDQIIEDHVTSRLNHGQVTIFTRSDMNRHNKEMKTRLKQMRKILDKNGIKFNQIDLEEQSKPDECSYALTMDTGYTQFPNIYFGEEHIGGIDDLQANFMTEVNAQRVLNDNGIEVNVSNVDDFDFQNTSVSETETDELEASYVEQRRSILAYDN